MGAVVEGPRPVGGAIETVLSRIIAQRGEEGVRCPRYIADGRTIVSVHTKRRQTPPLARQALGFLIESALSATDEDLSECDILMAADLIRAIRQAERNDPTPPAAIAQAA